MEKQVIILFGPPGAGKGTQAELLADKFGFYHFETSKIIEACLKNESPEKVFKVEGVSYKVKDEREKWSSGALNSPPFVVFLVLEKIKELAKEGKSIVFSGSPRSIYESEREIPLLKKLYGLKNIKFVVMEIQAETTIFRNSHRKVCELMRHSILFSPETEKLTKCPLDGSNLTTRKLDNPEAIKKRLEVFKNETYPVIDSIEKQDLPAKKVNGEQSVADVHKDILSCIQ